MSIIDGDPKWRSAMRRIELRARRGLHTVIHGGSGTGKEIAARHYHEQSGRRGPLVAVNCADLTPELARGELCGHAAYAFTGASKEGRPGVIQRANNGTLHLDEIADLCPKAQGILLRILEEGMVMRVGAPKAEYVDVRVVATSKTDLRSLVDSGEFREDLWYRLAAVKPLHLPPIGERCREDRERFVNLWVPDGFELTDEALELLVSRPYAEGGVREVRQAVLAAVEEAEIEGVEEVRARHVLEPDEERPEAELLLHTLFASAVAGGAPGVEAKEVAEALNCSTQNARRLLEEAGFRAVGGGRSWHWVPAEREGGGHRVSPL